MSISSCCFIKPRRQLSFVFDILKRSVRTLSNMGDDINPDVVLDFWFPKDTSVDIKLKNWFGGGPQYDEDIKNKFQDLVSKARNGELSSWEDPNKIKHAMAFILLIDQFCRNIYRGTADMYSHDHKPLQLALKMIELGTDKKLTFEERFFVYLPLEHCEDREIQAKCVAKYEEGLSKAVDEFDKKIMGSGVTYSKAHKVVVDEFGRFPKRNVILNRPNTPEEEEALKDWKHAF